jgi:hypothetical protein
MCGKKRTAKSNISIGNRIINELEDLGFVACDFFNQNKYLYLKKPSLALIDGDYNTGTRNNLAKSLKNNKFMFALMNVEYFLQNNSILHFSDMHSQLLYITKVIYREIIRTHNKYRYDCSSIEQILDFASINSAIQFIENKPEHECKLGIIRTLWTVVGKLYKSMLLQRQTVLLTPEYLNVFSHDSGEIILHYIPDIVFYDISKDKAFYKEKMQSLFSVFNSIQDNDLRNMNAQYIRNKRFEPLGKHIFGFKATLLGVDEEVLLEKKHVIDSELSNPYSPVMDYTTIFAFDLGKYLYHASRKSNAFANKHDEMLTNLILRRYIAISSKNNVLTDKNKSSEITSSITSSNKKVSKEESILSNTENIDDNTILDLLRNN